MEALLTSCTLCPLIIICVFVLCTLCLFAQITDPHFEMDYQMTLRRRPQMLRDDNDEEQPLTRAVGHQPFQKWIIALLFIVGVGAASIFKSIGQTAEQSDRPRINRTDRGSIGQTADQEM